MLSTLFHLIFTTTLCRCYPFFTRETEAERSHRWWDWIQCNPAVSFCCLHFQCYWEVESKNMIWGGKKQKKKKKSLGLLSLVPLKNKLFIDKNQIESGWGCRNNVYTLLSSKTTRRSKRGRHIAGSWEGSTVGKQWLNILVKADVRRGF